MSSESGSDSHGPHGAELGTDKMEDVDETSSSAIAVKHYRRTREEAVACKGFVPYHEMFDMDTGLMKEKYRRMRSPSPPTGTTVYEVATGRPYEFIGGMDPQRLFLDSLGMSQIRKEAIRAGVWKPDAGGSKSVPHARDDTTVHSVAGPSGTSGLRRVRPGFVDYSAPDPTAGPSRATDHTESRGKTQITQRTSKELRRATEKVLGWPTCTPEPQEKDVSPRNVVNEEPHMCNCVSLVSSAPVSMDMEAPDAADLDDRQLAENTELKQIFDVSPSLRYLRSGYLNYVENRAKRDVQRLIAYSCRSAPFKVYNVYKSITCRRLQSSSATTHFFTPQSTGIDTSESSDRRSRPVYSLHYKAMTIINQYLNVFSVLADFTYRWMSPSPLGEICNAIVVDKQFTYNHIRKGYLPYYRLLVGDSLTDLFVNQVRKVENRGISVKHVRFLSTPNTLLYTNSLSLTRRINRRHTEERETHGGVPETTSKKRRGGSPLEVGEHGEVGVTEDTVTEVPLKKRRVYGSTETKQTESTRLRDTESSKRRLSFTSNAYVLSTKTWPHLEHRASCSGSGTVGTSRTETSPQRLDTDTSVTSEELDATRHAHTVESEARNPTLVVFKHNFGEHEPDTLICHIVVEIHLGGEVKY